MCNFNQVFRGMQRYRHLCYHRKMHQIVAAPCRSSEQKKSSEESIEVSCSQTSPPAEETSRSQQLTKISSWPAPKTPDTTKTKPFLRKPAPVISQKKKSNKSSDSSVSSINKKLSKQSSLQAKLSHKVSVDKSLKIQRLSGGSIEIKKNKKSCVCNICQKDSPISGCSSDYDFGSPMSIPSPTSSKTIKKIKPEKLKSEPQEIDLKALVRAKPKRKKIVQRRSAIRAIEGPNNQKTDDADGVWFECNLPFRVNFPFPISILNLFGSQSFPNNVCQSKSIVPARNGGNPFSTTIRKALPAPVQKPQPPPATTKKCHRRLKTPPSPSLISNPSPSLYETSTQTGDKESELLCCLNEIRNHLAAKPKECRCFAEKSTYAEISQCQKKAREGKRSTQFRKIKSVPSTISHKGNNSSKSSVNVVIKSPTKTNKTERKPKKRLSISSTTSVSGKKASMSSLNEVSSCYSSLYEVQKAPIRAKVTTSATSLKGKYSHNKLEKTEGKGQHIKKPPAKPRRSVGLKDEDIENPTLESLEPKSKVENQQIPKPWLAWAVPPVFPNECALCHGSHYRPRCMCRGYMAGTHPIHQTPQYRGHCTQQYWPTCRRNSYFTNNTPKTVYVYERPSSPTVQCVKSDPCQQFVVVNSPNETNYPCNPFVGAGPPKIPVARGNPCRQLVEECPPKVTNLRNNPCKPQVEVEPPKVTNLISNPCKPQVKVELPKVTNLRNNPCKPQAEECPPKVTNLRCNPCKPQVEVEPPKVTNLTSNPCKPLVEECPPKGNNLISNPCKPQVEECSPKVTNLRCDPCKPLVEECPPKVTNLRCNPCKPLVEECPPKVTNLRCNPCKPKVEECPPKVTNLRCNPCKPQVEESLVKVTDLRCPCKPLVKEDQPKVTNSRSYPCKPLVEVKKCEKIEPVRKASVGFHSCPQVFSAYTTRMSEGSRSPSTCNHQRQTPEYTSKMTQCQPSCMHQRQTPEYTSKMTQCLPSCMHQKRYPEYDPSMTQELHYGPSCMYQRRSPRHCYRRFVPNWQTQKPAIPISSSTEYNKKALLKKRNAVPKDSLLSQTPMVCPWRPGFYRSVNCKPSSRSICFRVIPSQPQIYKRTGHMNNGCTPCWRRNQHYVYDRISSGGENNGFEKSSFHSGSIVENIINQQYYFPLIDKNQPSNRSLNLQEENNDKTDVMICKQVVRNKSDRVLSHEKVININKRQSNPSRDCSKKGEVCVSSGKPQKKDNMSSQKSEDQIIVSFTNRSFSVNSEEFSTTALGQKISQKQSNGSKSDKYLALKGEDINEARAGSLKNSEKFRTRPKLSNLSRRLNRVSENMKNIPCNNEESNSKHQSIPSCRYVSGMTMPSNSTDKKIKKRQKSPISNKNSVLVNKRKRSCSAPGCIKTSVPPAPKTEKRSRTTVIYRQCISHRNQIPSKFYTLTQDADNESFDNEPAAKIKENYKLKDKDIFKIPDYSINATAMKVKQTDKGKGPRISPSQGQERTHAAPRFKPDLKNMQPKRNLEFQKANYKDSRQSLPYLMVSSPTEIINDCQPDECFKTKPPMPHSSNQLGIKSDELNQISKNRRQPRERPLQGHSPSPYCTHIEYHQCKDIPKTRIRMPKSNTSRSPWEEEYCPPSDHSFSRPNEDQNYGQEESAMLRKSCSEDSLSSSEECYYSRTCKFPPKYCKCNSTSFSSSPYSSSAKSNVSVESRGKSSRSICYNYHAKKNPELYSGNRSKCRCTHENTSEILSSRCDPSTRCSDSESMEISPQTSKEGCKPNNTYSKSMQSGRTTDMETMEAFTLLQPHAPCRNDSAMIRNSDVITENTVLFEIMTTCKKDNLLETCARPPQKFRSKQNAALSPTDVSPQASNYHPPNGRPFVENYRIDSRDHWRSPAMAPAPSCQQQLQIQKYSRYNPQLVREAIEVLPFGFYDQTVQQYNLIRMESDFQPPPLGPEVIQAVTAMPPSHYGYPVHSYCNPMQQQMMIPVQDYNRPFFLPQNQIQHRLPTEPTVFNSRQPR